MNWLQYDAVDQRMRMPACDTALVCANCCLGNKGQQRSQLIDHAPVAARNLTAGVLFAWCMQSVAQHNTFIEDAVCRCRGPAASPLARILPPSCCADVRQRHAAMGGGLRSALTRHW